MQGIALELNKSAPFMVDDQTRFDSAVVLPNNGFKYHYTLVNVDGAKDSIDAKGFERVFRPTMVSFVRTNPEMQVFRDHQISITYAYYDSCSRFLTAVQINPDDYLKQVSKHEVP